jgi:ribosomal protein S18 acetylase RimI-like enzyme
VSSGTQTTIRRLGPGDADVVRNLAERPFTALLADDRTVFMAAFDGDDCVGFAFGYVLPRRHRVPTMLFVYEIEVDESHRGRGIGARLMRALADEAGADEGFVLTEPDNDAANALYASVGGTRSDVVEWDFEYAGA